MDETDNVFDLKRKLKSDDRQVIVTTIQKLQRLITKKLEEGSSEYNKIKNLKIAFVVDECHRAVTPGTKRELERFFRNSLWYGFTGTPRFAENAYLQMGDLPRTTEELYGKQLHKYTIQNAIHDNAVLGFQVEHNGPKNMADETDSSIYESEAHMLSVLDVILNKSYHKLGFQNGKGKTYEGLLTTSSIQMAQKYYDLLKRVKNGETELQIDERIKQVLPDFPKFAITYSVTENEEGSHVNQQKMQESLDDYNEMFGTKYELAQIQGYNGNLNKRLARKDPKFQSRNEQLDLVIVVDRLLTGFDAPCMSTIFIDRQPMGPHDLIQAFSRTNRIYDKNKTYGQIVTFQAPKLFKESVDNAVKLYSAGSTESALVAEWDEIEPAFRKALKALRVSAETPEEIPGMSRKEKIVFIKMFQNFDKLFAQLKSFTQYDDSMLEEYGITQDEYEDYVAHYLNVKEEVQPKPDDPQDGDEEPTINMLMLQTRINRKYGEYIALMNFLSETEMDLLQLVNLSDKRFWKVYSHIYNSTNTHDFGEVILKIRNNYAKHSNKLGRYTIRYILLNLKEEILEVLLPNQFNNRCLSNELYITSKCYPFEQEPFISNLAGKKTSKGDIRDVIEIVDDINKFKRVQPYLKIEGLIKETGELFFEKNMIATSEAIKKYNDSLDLWEQNNGFLINEKGGMVSIDSYERTTMFILKRLLKLSHISNREQQRYNEKYLRECGIEFEDKLKKIALKSLFVSSQIMLIYGAAGTGKTTLINYISQMMIQSKKLFLSKTHTALQNLRRRVDDGSGNMQFSSIDRVIKSNEIINYDIVFVDECSTIDNRTIKTLLEKMNEDTKLVLCGDIYQIESIDFGNWFYYAKNIIDSKGANIELLHTWRTDKEELSGLWEEVREKRTIITEKLSMDGPFSENLGKSIFTLVDDEVILCLNYDGKFGLNSMNQYFQNANTKSEAFTWAEWIFKIGDRIIFLDTRRSSLLYNNLKGVIEDIIKTMSSIVFTININTYLTEEQCRYETFEYIENTDYGTRIRLEVIAWDDDLAEEDRIKTVVPFQIAYAISIHKAQGLEYNSVKVVVPSSNAEKITHSIFYTAITRAKEKLKIYWSAETMDAIVKSFKEPKIEYKSIQLIKEKLVLEDEC